jgi:predicted alpha/beta-hydrolase family hydrolase
LRQLCREGGALESAPGADRPMNEKSPLTGFAATPLTVRVSPAQDVSALLNAPPNSIACFVFAHGAGAGMTHPFMAAIAQGLFERQVATLRYQFPFVENASKRPDSPPVAHAAIRTAVAEAARRFPSVPLFAGGKSFGGRMTSQAQAKESLPNVLGLAFFGFPLHPAGKASVDRAAHLSAISIPMLFLQGTRDTLAELSLMTATVDQLGTMATLKVIDGADHAFHVLARSGRTDVQAIGEMLDTLSAWIRAVVDQQEEAAAI